jgi:folate-binding protein YgfZ
MNLEIYRRAAAGEPLLVDLSSRARWRLSGPDALRYLNGQATQDVSKLREGNAAYAAICTAKGRMEGDLFAARHGGVFFLDADGALHESLGARLDKYLVADDAAFEDITESWSLQHILGSAAPELTLPPEGFIAANARFGLPGHDVWTPGEPLPLTMETVDEEIVETLRVEHGVPRWGAELGAHTLPPEAGPVMERAISYTKGCYVGQEIIARLKSVGQTPRTLVFLRGETEAAPKPGVELKREGKVVGTVTSALFSPRLNCGIALSYVARALAVVGTEFEADGLKFTVAHALTAEVAA